MHSLAELLKFIWRSTKTIVIFVVGVTLIVAGIVMLVVPGPGLLVIVAGLAVLATEFAWAERVLRHAKGRYDAWNGWLKRQHAVVKAAVWAVEVVEVFPFLEFVVEDFSGVDDDAVEESVELLGVDAVGSFDLAVEPRGVGFDADVVDAFIEQVPVEGGAELRSVVGLDPLHRERQLGQGVVDEGDGGLLVAALVGPQGLAGGCSR